MLAVPHHDSFSGTQRACDGNDQTCPRRNVDRQATEGIDAQPCCKILGAVPVGAVLGNGLDLGGDGRDEQQMGEGKAGARGVPTQRSSLLQRRAFGVEVGDRCRHCQREQDQHASDATAKEDAEVRGE